ncbi:TIGR01777 family oxidoreductase [Plantactinospora sp. B5E13]|uniref:TIGR01777 family oxidoreductase n=1 Tax=unclassified Plantactinospora TaxID=2631981 RepID=UPI00325D7FC7
MRIVLAGSSGFLGTRLTDRLRTAGHEIVRLVRRPVRDRNEVRWDPAAGQLDPTAISGADAVINLAGTNISDRRWNSEFKDLLRASRVDTTATLARSIATLPAGQRPQVLLNGSAIGWYGDTGDRPVEEDAPAGDGFMADLCRVWEAATAPAEQAGIRVVRLRLGLPLDRTGGFLKPQLLPYRLGIAGTFGDGRQWIPWISMADCMSALSFLLTHDDIAGPVNVVGPAPATNAEFTRTLGRALHRPTVMPVPGVALRILLGEMSVEALRSLRVLPGVLNRAGFRHEHPDLAGALRAALD